MTDTKHADGDWSFDADNFTIVADGTAVLADVMDFDDFPCLDPGEVDEQAFNAQCAATGRVMAAGSALLAAARRLVPMPELVSHGNDDEVVNLVTSIGALRQLIAAIARAAEPS